MEHINSTTGEEAIFSSLNEHIVAPRTCSGCSYLSRWLINLTLAIRSGDVTLGDAKSSIDRLQNNRLEDCTLNYVLKDTVDK